MSSPPNNWTISDPLFYPLGLFNSASRNKTVFVTWSYNTLLTYVFKKSGTSSTSLKDIYKIELPGVVRQIILTEFNTLCLTESGHVYYFRSIRSLKRLDFLDGDNVRCISTTRKGFAIIKITSKKRIQLEVYDDFKENPSEANLNPRSFDVTFDEDNLLNSTWKNEQFTIHAIVVSEENRKFLEQFAKQSIESDELFLFSINNSLFGLFEKPSDESGFQIVVANVLPSNIESVQFINHSNVLVILMACGVLEIVYYSKLNGWLERVKHMIGTEIVSSTFADDCFYYSDERQLVKCRFVLEENPELDQDNIAVKKTEKSIVGIAALTWVPTMRKLICLSVNNIFYRVKFEDENDFEAGGEFFDLDDEKLEQVENHFAKYSTYAEQPEKIRQQIRDEHHKLEMIAVCGRKAQYSNCIRAEIKYHKCIPPTSGIVIYPICEQIISKDTFFALIKVRINPNPTFCRGFWRIDVESFGEKYIFKSIPINSDLIASHFHIILQIRRGDAAILPEIRLSLASSIQVGTDFMYISIAAQVTGTDIAELFATKSHTIIDPNRQTVAEKMKCLHRNVAESEDQLEFTSTLRTPLSMCLGDLEKMFEMLREPKSLQEQLVVYFLGEKITFDYNEAENTVEIKSYDPAALFYTKKHLASKLYNQSYGSESSDADESLQSILKLQAELKTKDIDSVPLKTYINSLKKIYTTLRQGILTRI